jgi:hypothetical protein
LSKRTKEVAIAMWLLFILALVILEATTGSAQNIEGQLIASQYGTWQVSGYAPDTYTFAPTACRVQGGNSFFPAFTAGTPVKIVDGDPNLTETVTPTNVISDNNACSISIAPVNHHNLPYYLTSATGGLQEAINANLTNPGSNTIILNNRWYQLGGSSSIISSVQGTTQLGLVDITTVPSTFYKWNGSQYVQAASADEVSSVFGRTGGVVAESGDYTCLQVTDCGAEPNAHLSTTLSTSISTTDTVIPLAASPSGLTTSGVVVIDSEWIAYSGISGNNLNGATRGYHQTTAASHASGASVNSILIDFTTPAQAPLDYLLAGEGPETSMLVINCDTPDLTGQVLTQFGCAGTGLEISDGGNILQNGGVGENKLQSATGIGPGGGLAPITNSGYLFDSTRQNQSAVPQGFGAGIAGPVESVQPTTIAAPTITNFAEPVGTTTWSYECTGTDVDGNTYPGTIASITNGPTTITSGEILVSCPFSAGAASETIWRTAGGPNQASMITGVQPMSLVDGGGSGTPGTPPTTNSSIPKVCTAGEASCLLSGAVAPTGSCTNGWLYSNTSGSPSALYQCEGAEWVAVIPSTVASVFGRTGAVVAASGDYTAAQVTNAAATNAANTYTAAGASSAPAAMYTGTPFTGGTGTTTEPYWYYNCSGSTAPTTFSTSGTIYGVNTCSGFTGNIFDFYLNGTEEFTLDSAGSIALAGNIAGRSLGTTTNCSSAASPAVCGGSPSGSVAVPVSSATLVVDTTAVTTNSQIQLTFDSSLGSRLGATCNTSIQQPTVSARTAGTSFTITLPTTVPTNPVCISYTIIN